MAVKGGRLELLVPHIVRGQLFRPGFVRFSLRLGAARQMPAWAKLQFTGGGITPEELDQVLGRIKSLESWVDEWQALGRHYETLGQEAQAEGRNDDAAHDFMKASSAYSYSQYVVFLDVSRKRLLHEACVRAYAAAAPLLNPPAQPFVVGYRSTKMKGYLRVPPGATLAPVVVIINGTNSVKEELHDWSECLLERGIATITFDGPGMGQTFRRITMIATPHSVGAAILNAIEAHPELDADAIGFMGLSLGGYMAIRMAASDARIKAVAAISPPYAASIYWNVTLAAMRRELAALYGITEAEMGASIERVTLDGVLDKLEAPMMIVGGGHDHLTPSSEAWKIFEEARCEREMVFYPRGAHECFNVIEDARPRVSGWLSRQLEKHRSRVARPAFEADGVDPGHAAEAVDPDFAAALTGDVPRPVWNEMRSPGIAARWNPWSGHDRVPIEVVCRSIPGLNGHGNGKTKRDHPSQLAEDGAF
jgi:2,6-dihydroxypseudooxynicotine hydrolase